MGWAVGWEFLQRMSGKWGPVRKHRGGTVGSALFDRANGGNRELQLWFPSELYATRLLGAATRYLFAVKAY